MINGLRTLVGCFIFFCLSISLIGQEDDIYRQFNHEVALDFKWLLNENRNVTQATNLTFKKKIEKGRFVNGSTTTWWRATISGSLDSDFITTRTTRDSVIYENLGWGNYLVDAELIGKSSYFAVLLGLEYQKQFNRFQFFYGMDLGYGHRRNKFVDDADRKFLPQSEYPDLDRPYIIEKYYVDDLKDHELNVHGLFGLKYFISPRFSVSIESKIRSQLILKIGKEYSINHDDLKKIEDLNSLINLNFRLSPSFLNAIFISYYF